MGDSMTFTQCSITSRLNCNVSKDLNDRDDLADPTASLDLSLQDTLTDGRGSDEGNMAYWDSGSIAAGGNQDFDLVGSLTTAFGDTVNFDRVKGVIVKNTGTAGSNGDIRVVGQTFSSWISAASDYVTVKPGGVMMFFAPGATAYDVSAGSDTLRLTNASGSLTATYQIAVIGTEIDSSSSSSSESSSSESSSSESSSSSSSESSSSP